MRFQKDDIVIFADDLTGALDAAVQFSKQNIPTIAFPTAEAFLENGDWSYCVYVVNTTTRHVARQEAYETVRALAAAVRRDGCQWVIKKTDSALRGNVGVELEALLDAFGSSALYFVPAYPQMRRTTENGVQYCDGVPIAESVFGEDPFEPVQVSEVSQIVAQTSGIPVQSVRDWSQIRLTDRPTIYCVDAQNDEDMLQICRLARECRVPVLLAGCAGLALALSSLMRQQPRPALPPQTGGEMFLISGSVNRITLQQIAYLKKRKYPVWYLDKQTQLDPAYPDSEAGAQFLSELCRQMHEHHVAVLSTSGTAEEVSSEGGQKYGVDQAISALTRQVMERERCCILTVFGGDTLFCVVRTVFSGGLIPLMEIMPGVPVSLARFRDGRECLVVSRSGGFGDEASAEAIVKYFER